MKKLIPILLFLLFLSAFLFSQNNNILAHSHNDYEQKTPLYKALGYGFNSIEIDVIRDGNQLIVSHDDENLDKKPTIEELYFKPLKNYFTKNKKRNIWLLVDVKKYDKKTLDVLHEILDGYENLFLKRNEPKKEKPLLVILSGDLPRKEIMDDEKYIYFFIDGRITDLNKGYSAELMPLISSNFSHHSKWTGRGEMDKEEYEAVLKIIGSVHAENRKIRFWKTPDKKKVWEGLIKMEVDVIGVDCLGKFDRYLK